MPSRELKSEVSTEKVFVRFLNMCKRKVDIIWVDFNGMFIRYKSLSHNEYVDVNTYATHPWLCLDSETGDRMLITDMEVFYAEPWMMRLRELQSQGRYVRFCLKITYPLYDLKTCALLAVRNYLRTADKIDDLEIPEVLKEDLKNIFEQTNASVTGR